MHQKMKSIQTKGKSKKSAKFAKFLVKSTTSRPDLSSLRKPIDTSVSDLCQVSELLEDGTDEVKSILSYECNIIYECRTCHSLFRSIVNLVSHKREYCREKFDITLDRHVLHNYNGPSARESIIHMYKTEQTNNDSIKNDRILRSHVSKETNKKDLSTIIDRLNKKREESMQKQLDNENTIFNTNNQQIYLEAIDTNCSAMYQTIKSSDAVAMDLMKAQITELHNMTDQNALALEEQSENQVEKSDSPIQANMSDEENESLIFRLNNFKPINNLSCAICHAKFSTKKTLTVHMKTLHTSERIYYPCPCCTNIFANSWSVFRHLYKVHKKTNEQVRKLRSQVQEKAFHRKTTAMKDIENVRAIKVSALRNVMEDSDEIQKPISHTESNTKLCSRRERKSKRKASLSTYLQYYQTPIAACDETTIRIKRCNKLSTSTSDISSEAEDINLVTNTIIEPSHDKNTTSKHILSSEICKSSIRIQNIPSFNKKDWNILENQHNHLSECNSDNNDDLNITSSVTQNIDNNKSMSFDENQDNFVFDKNLKLPEAICTDTNEISSDLIFTPKIRNKKRKVSSQHNKKQLTDSKEKDMIKVENDDSKLQSSCSPNEKNQTLLMKSKIATIANFRKLRCLPCRRKFTSVPNLRRHMAMHIGWNRYRCLLCNFKCFVKCDCVAHCNKVHNMQNDRAAIAKVIFEIPEDEYNEDVTTNVTNPKEKSNSSDITDVTTSSCQLETHVENSNGFSDSGTHDTSQSSEANSEDTATSERVAESQGNIECQNIDAENSDARMQDLSESVMNCESGKLDDNPELKRMVMEVIFGSMYINASKQTDSDKSALKTSDCTTGLVDANDNENSASVIESKEASYPILDNVKHQRPMRNRIRHLNEDFIYDLKEVAYRKESAFISDSETSHVRKKVKLQN